MKSTLPALALLFFTASGYGAERVPPGACVEIARLTNAGELDQAMKQVSSVAADEFGPRDPDMGWDSESDDYLELMGVLEVDASTYLVYSLGAGPAYASTDQGGRQRVVCRFGLSADQSELMALTQFEALARAAAEAGLGLWEFAVRARSTGPLEILLEERVPMNDPARGQALLTQAFAAGRLEAFDWLLLHGADPNEGRDEHYQVLQNVLWQEDYGRAVAVMRAGGMPLERDIEKIAEILDTKPDAPEVLGMATVERLQVLPEAILIGALRRPNLFTTLVDTRLPVRPDWWEWHAGVRIAIRPEAAEEYAKYPGALAKAQRAYAKLVPPIRHHAIVRYGDGTKGWKFQLAGRNPMPHEELLLFATAFCVYFLPEDCGAAELQRRAEAWARNLAKNCGDSKHAARYELAPCNTVVFYDLVTKPKSPKPMFLLPTGTNWGKGTYSIEEMYRAKLATK